MAFFFHVSHFLYRNHKKYEAAIVPTQTILCIRFNCYIDQGEKPINNVRTKFKQEDLLCRESFFRTLNCYGSVQVGKMEIETVH